MSQLSRRLSVSKWPRWTYDERCDTFATRWLSLSSV